MQLLQMQQMDYIQSNSNTHCNTHTTIAGATIDELHEFTGQYRLQHSLQHSLQHLLQHPYATVAGATTDGLHTVKE